MHIAITGATGFLGRYLVRHLRTQDIASAAGIGRAVTAAGLRTKPTPSSGGSARWARRPPRRAGPGHRRGGSRGCPVGRTTQSGPGQHGAAGVFFGVNLTGSLNSSRLLSRPV